MHQTYGTLALLAGLLLATPVLAACGGDEEPDTAALTKPQLIQNGDDLCRASNERIAQAEARLGEDPSEQELLAHLEDTLLPEIRGQLRDLRALEPPAEEADAYDALLDELAAQVARAEEHPAAAFASDTDAFARANELAQDLGFQVCGGE